MPGNNLPHLFCLGNVPHGASLGQNCSEAEFSTWKAGFFARLCGYEECTVQCKSQDSFTEFLVV